MQKRVLLTRSEMEIMRVIWDDERPELWCKEIIDQMPDPKPAYTTVATFLRILTKRGVLNKHVRGGVLYYSAKVSLDDYRLLHLQETLKDLFQDDPVKMAEFVMTNCASQAD